MRRGVIFACALGVVLAGCTDDGGDSDGGAGDGPVELTFWSWTSNIDTVVAAWNTANPDIQVTVSEQAAGDDLVTLVLNSAQSGDAPDLVQVEYQALPTLVSNDVLADISEYVGDAAGEFTPGLWQQVTLGTEAVYAVPQDSGPMMFYYRADIFEELGLEVPTTWDEFAETARAVREADPDRYLMTFSSTDPGWFAGLSQQAGASWWAVEGESWRVSINDEATQRVAEYWGDLVAEDAIDDQPMYTPEWNAALNDGSQIGWISAIWAPAVLEGNAGDTANQWRMAPLPQWSPGENATGNWGGSSTGVTNDSENAEAAAEFARWMNTAPEAVELLITESTVYPASISGQSSPALSEPPAFFSEQTDFYQQAQAIADTAAGFIWGPNVNVAYDAYRDAFGAAITDGTPFADAVAQMQQVTIDDMRQQGFTVTE
jgi:multiple sugar transport system substrate-binding protein